MATPEMGIHGVIEFANRLLTFVLIAIAIVMFVLVLRIRQERKELFRLALAIGLGIPMQGVIGGLTVLSNLNPYVVGLHFVLSVVLVVLSTVLAYRVFYGRGGRIPLVPTGYVVLAHVAVLLTAITILVGIITTGSGPHSGDGGASRNGLNPEWLQHVHSWPAYALVAVSAILLLGAFRMPHLRLRRFASTLVVVELAQVAVGLAQARMGLPEILVGTHMVLAVCLASAMTAVVLSLREPAPTD